MGGDRAKKLVLVVEDEPVLRASMVRALTRLGVEVVDAATQHDGLELLRACAPDLVVTDLDLADGSAVPVIARASAPVIVISAFLNEFHDELRRFRTIRVHAKPLPIPSLVAEVTELLGVARPRRTPFSATDYIQLACMSQHSVVIEMHEGEGVLAGTIIVRQGAIWSARDVAGEGTDALRRLLFDGQAEAAVYALDDAQAGEGNISGSWQQVLLDAARVHDESAPSQPPPPKPPEKVEVRPLERDVVPPRRPPMPVRPRATPPAPAVGFDVLLERGIEALLKRRLQEAHDLFSEAAALRPNDERVKENLVRLERAGIRKR